MTVLYESLPWQTPPPSSFHHFSSLFVFFVPLILLILVLNNRKNPSLRKKVLQYLRGDNNLADRLIQLAKTKHPGKSEKWYLEKILYDLKRGR